MCHSDAHIPYNKHLYITCVLKGMCEAAEGSRCNGLHRVESEGTELLHNNTALLNQPVEKDSSLESLR